MRWDHVMQVCREEILADQTLQAIFDDAVRMGGTGDHRVPLIELWLIGDSETELWAACTIQFDFFTKTDDDMVATERRLRQLFHLDIPRPIGGIGMFGEYQDGEVLASPSRDHYFGRAIRFRMTPLRQQYDSTTP